MASAPKRPYPDWHRLVPKRFREEIYNGDDDWTLHYNTDWASFLYYCNILHNKDYCLEGGLPAWLESYIEKIEVTPFDYKNEDIILVFHKDKWVTNTLTFYLEDRVTESGAVYNMSFQILPSNEFSAGNPAPGRGACPQSTWEPYLVAYANHLFPGNAWNPVKIK